MKKAGILKMNYVIEIQFRMISLKFIRIEHEIINDAITYYPENLGILLRQVPQNFQRSQRRPSRLLDFSRKDLRPEFPHILRRHVLDAVEKPRRPVVIGFAVENLLVAKLGSGVPDHGSDVRLPFPFLELDPLPDAILVDFHHSASRLVRCGE